MFLALYLALGVGLVWWVTFYPDLFDVDDIALEHSVNRNHVVTCIVCVAALFMVVYPIVLVIVGWQTRRS